MEISGVGSTDNVVQGNKIGTDVTGTHAIGNVEDGGVLINDGASYNTIGGTESGARNVISGNSGNGVNISRGLLNVVQNNLIGTNIEGTGALANFVGVGVEGGTSAVTFPTGQNLIGGSTAGAGNVISGNGAGGGIYLYEGVLNVVAGNLIGTNASGTAAVPNDADGIAAQYGGHNTIGGTTAGAGNVISGNEGADGGVSLYYETGDLVAGNKIGTDITGTVALGNDRDGVVVSGESENNTIGGTTTGAGNLISGNADDGIYILASGNVVAGNQIGTDVTGTIAIPNNEGVEVDASGNTIGGTTAGAGNLISGNVDCGVLISTSATDNLVEGNRIGTDTTGSTGAALRQRGGERPGVGQHDWRHDIRSEQPRLRKYGRHRDLRLEQSRAREPNRHRLRRHVRHR